MGFEDLYGLQVRAPHQRKPWKIPCISPHSYQARIWDVVVAIASFSSSIISVFQVCLDTSIQSLWAIQYFLDTICVLNIGSRFYIGFLSHGMVIMDKSEIRKHYLRHWFCLDVLSSFPFELIKLAFPEDVGLGQIVTYCRMSCLLRIFRFFALISYLSGEPRVNKTYLAVIRYASLLILLIHTCGCIWYSIGCSRTHYLVKRHCFMNTSWPKLLLEYGQNLENMTIGENYVVSIYWATATVTEIEYGDIFAQNTSEVIISIVSIWLGTATISGMIMAGMSSLASNSDARRGQYYYRLKSIQKNMDDIGVTKKVQRWVINYYMHLWERYRGCVVEGLLDDLPYCLYSEVTMACTKPVLSKAEIFKGTDEGFRRALSTTIHPYSYSAGQILIRDGEINQTLYFVEHGLLKVTGSSERDRIATLLPGCLIGEVSLMYGISKDVSVTAATNCEILVLKRKDLQQLFLDYPKAAEKISRLARARCYNVGRPIREAFDVGVASHPKHVIFHKDLGKNLKPQDEKIFTRFMEAVGRWSFNFPAAIRTTLTEHRRNAFWHKTMPPDSVIVKRWEVFIVVCQVLVIYITTWILFFKSNTDSVGHSIEKTGRFVLPVLSTIDVLFVVDIIFRLRTQVPSADGNMSDFRSIFHNYVSSWEIYCDILSVLPLELFGFARSGNFDWSIFGFLRINRLLWIRKLLKFMKNYERDLQNDVVNYLIMKSIIILLFSAHICAGMFYLSGCFYNSCDPDSWLAHTDFLKNMSDFNDYMVAIYWATTTLTLTGTGDINAYTSYERLTAIATSIVGLFVYTYITARIGASQASATLARGQMNPGGSHLMGDLQPELQQIIFMKERGNLISKIPFFYDIDNDIIHELAEKSQIYFFPPGEIIQYRGTLSRELYYIRRGKCEVLSADSTRIVATFRKRAYFGETGFLFGVPDTLTVRARTHCEILVLDFDKIGDVLNKHPIIKSQLEGLQQDKEYCNAMLEYVSVMEAHICDGTDLPETMIGTSQNTAQVPKMKRTFQCCARVGVPRPSRKKDSLSRHRGVDQAHEQERGALLDRSQDFFCILMPRKLLMKQAVLQNNRLFQYWEMVRLLLAFVISIICSTQVAFFHLNTPLWIVSYLLEVICWFDMYLHFHVAFYHRGKLVTDPLLTAKHYLHTNFLFDLISCFPWEIFALMKYSLVNDNRELFSHENLQLFACCRIPHILQLYRIHLAFNYWRSDIATEKPWITFLQFFIYNAVFLHVCSCLVLISVNQIAFIDEQSDSSLYNTDQLILRRTWMDKLPHVFPITTENMTLLDFYTLSLYFSTQMVCNVGFGDIYPTAIETVVTATLLMMTGALFYSWMVGTAISIIANADTARIQYTEKLNSIKYFLKNQNIRGPIYEKIVNFYSYKWLRTKGVEPNTLFDFLPCSLLGDISTALYADLIAKTFGLHLNKDDDVREKEQKDTTKTMDSAVESDPTSNRETFNLHPNKDDDVGKREKEDTTKTMDSAVESDPKSDRETLGLNLNKNDDEVKKEQEDTAKTMGSAAELDLYSIQHIPPDLGQIFELYVDENDDAGKKEQKDTTKTMDSSVESDPTSDRETFELHLNKDDDVREKEQKDTTKTMDSAVESDPTSNRETFGLHLNKDDDAGKKGQEDTTKTMDSAGKSDPASDRESTLNQSRIERLEMIKCFIQMLAKRIRPCLFQAHNDIFKRNDYGEEMFFIDKGEVEVLSDDEKQVVAKLKPGQYFGEWSLVFKEPRMATARAATNCDLYILEKKDLEDVMKYFPAIYKEIVRAASFQRRRALVTVVLDHDGITGETDFTDHESGLMRMYREYIDEEQHRVMSAAYPSQSLFARLWVQIRIWVEDIPEKIVKLHSTTVEPGSILCTGIQYISSIATMISFWSITYMISLGASDCTVYIVCEICEFILITEIFFKFHIRYHDENGTNFKRYQPVSQHYLRKKMGFIFDMICAFPISSFAHISLKENDVRDSVQFLARANIIHILRMVNVPVFIYEQEKNINNNVSLIRLFKCVVLLLVFFHVSALLFIYTACPDFCHIDSWLSFIPMFSESVKPGNTIDWTLSDIYINALYWVVSRLTITGYGDVRNRWLSEVWLTILAMFVGKFVVGYVQGVFSATEANAYALQVSFEEKIQAVKTYMLNKKVPSSLQDRVMRFYSYLFDRTRGLDFSTLFEDTPSCMKSEIFGRIGLNLLKKQRLFNNLPEHYLIHLCTTLTLISYSAGEYLIQKGDTIAKMILIVNGKVTVSGLGEEGTLKKTFLMPGQAYGVRFLFDRGLAKRTLQAENYVNILNLSKEDFENVSSLYEEVQEIIHNRGRRLLSNIP
ncbi:uncharacterized protein LOC144768773 isoform X2 [Lissotriton helveticus]